MRREPSHELVEHIREWLGPRGVALFRRYRRWAGSVSPTFGRKANRPIPHPVHFREGMQVRNAMRASGLCSDWNDHDIDDMWTLVVEKAITE